VYFTFEQRAANLVMHLADHSSPLNALWREVIANMWPMPHIVDTPMM
jgi:hypothetical protein